MKLPSWKAPLTLALLGGLLIYGLGKWDGWVGARDAATVRQARLVLAAGNAYRARQAEMRADSIRQAERVAGLERLAASQKWDIARLKALEASQTRPGDTMPTDTVAVSIGLWRADSATWATDSAGVRLLAGHVWRSVTLLPAVEAFQATVDSLLAATRDRLATSETGRALAEARVTVLETSLADLLKVADCKIAWVIPCPSRTASLVVGIGLGIVADQVVRRLLADPTPN